MPGLIITNTFQKRVILMSTNSTQCQNFSLIANWNSRGVPLPVGEVPLTVVVI
jgi:hypothetical protein